MITISFDDLALFVCLITLVISLYTLFVARRTEERCKAQIEAFQNAPILRQYVEKFVPIDESPKAKQIIEKARRQASEEFEKMYNLGDLEGTKTRKPSSIFTKGDNGESVEIDPKDLV